MAVQGKSPQSGTEVFFGFDELFFSRTDPHGIIEYGNEVFIRVAGYSRDKLIGSPHNIVRHPSTPKAVFKLLWSEIQAGRTLGAYVRNKTSEGGHYWVFGTVFPVENGFLSIRLRPSSELSEVVKKIYEQMLVEEKVNGLDASLELLKSLLNQSGYADYQSFMTAALLEELRCRDSQLDPQSARVSISGFSATSAIGQVAGQISEKFGLGSSHYSAILKNVSEFDGANKLFVEKSSHLLSGFQDLQLISLNMKVFSSKFGSSGATLGVLAGEFQRVANDVEQNLVRFSKFVETVGQAMRESSFSIGSLKLQMDMVAFFVRECLGQIAAGGAVDERFFYPLESSTRMFSSLAEGSSRLSIERLTELRGGLSDFQSTMNDIKKSIKGLELISQMGSVEAARVPDFQQSFAGYIQQMNDFNGVLRSSVRDIGISINALGEALERIAVALTHVSLNQDDVFKLALSLRETYTTERKAQGSAQVEQPSPIAPV